MVLGLLFLVFVVWIVYLIGSSYRNEKNNDNSKVQPQHYDVKTVTIGGTRVKTNVQFSVDDILNKRVSHKSFGIGTIIDISDASNPQEKYLTVKFENETKKFVYPRIFTENKMTCCDSSLQERMEQAINPSLDNHSEQTKEDESIANSILTEKGKISVCTGNCSTCERDACIEDKHYESCDHSIQNNLDHKEERKMKSGQIVYARTHAEFLNSTFGTNYKQWMKSVWNYDDNTIVWMVRFNRAKDGWRNSFVSSNVIREENLEHALEWNGRSVAERLDIKRIVIEINEEEMCRKYIFRGVYTYDEEKSNPYAARYYNKISNEFIKR